jgi:hypothetical protein
MIDILWDLFQVFSPMKESPTSFSYTWADLRSARLLAYSVRSRVTC